MKTLKRDHIQANSVPALAPVSLSLRTRWKTETPFIAKTALRQSQPLRVRLNGVNSRDHVENITTGTAFELTRGLGPSGSEAPPGKVGKWCSRDPNQDGVSTSALLKVLSLLGSAPNTRQGGVTQSQSRGMEISSFLH